VSHVTRIGDSGISYRALVWRPERKRSLWKPMRRGEDNIKIDIFTKWNRETLTRLIWLRIGASFVLF